MVRKIKSNKTSSNTNNQGDILKQAQVMQQEMLKVQEDLKDKKVTSSVGGGAVTVVMNCKRELLELTLSDEIVKEATTDKELLQDLIISAVTESMRQAEELEEQEMAKITGGVSIPGLF